jgi:hypothetical protein
MADNVSEEHGGTSVLKKDLTCFSEMLVASCKDARFRNFEDLISYPVYLLKCGIRLSKRYWLLVENEHTYLMEDSSKIRNNFFVLAGASVLSRLRH